jgi:hypothetical protein
MTNKKADTELPSAVAKSKPSAPVADHQKTIANHQQAAAHHTEAASPGSSSTTMPNITLKC